MSEEHTSPPDWADSVRDWIDLDDLLDRCLGNRELANRAINRFVAGLNETVDSLQTLKVGGDLAEIASRGHRLKGEAANVGCRAISEQAAQLEEFAQQRLHDAVMLGLDLLTTTCHQFLTQVGGSSRPRNDPIRAAAPRAAIRLAPIMNVLIADDDPGTVELLEHALQRLGYDVTTASDGAEAWRLVRTGRFRMLITDWQMPGMTGLELCEKIRKQTNGQYVYIIVLTSYTGLDGVVCCLEAGADDYLNKPFRSAELFVRIRAGERLLNLESRETTIFALAKLVESRDNETGGHLERMREYARILAEDLSRQPEFENEVDGSYIKLLYLTTPLHDIGKVAIPDAILRKPGKLTPEEIDTMRGHTTIGAQTLGEVASMYQSAAYLAMARDIALTHHEWYDGSGYPYGLSGEDIPLCGRITALADVYDALTSKRSYKPAFEHEEARRIILDSSGKHFDPKIIAAFLRCEERFQQTARRMQAPSQRSTRYEGSYMLPDRRPTDPLRSRTHYAPQESLAMGSNPR